MKICPTTSNDNKKGLMRVEFDGNDIELLEEAIDRLRRLVKVEEALDVVGTPAISFLGHDIPTATADAAEFLDVLVKGWDAPAKVIFHPGDPVPEYTEPELVETD